MQRLVFDRRSSERHLSKLAMTAFIFPDSQHVAESKQKTLCALQNGSSIGSTRGDTEVTALLQIADTSAQQPQGPKRGNRTLHACPQSPIMQLAPVGRHLSGWARKRGIHLARLFALCLDAKACDLPILQRLSRLESTKALSLCAHQPAS